MKSISISSNETKLATKIDVFSAKKPGISRECYRIRDEGKGMKRVFIYRRSSRVTKNWWEMKWKQLEE